MKIDLVYGDDWEGVYIGGKLFNEGHTVDWEFVIPHIVGKDMFYVKTAD